MKTKVLKIVFLVVIAFCALGAEASTSCTFVRDMGEGMGGEDVRCLQQYLNDSGYGTTFSRFSYPDGIFGPLTRQAVMHWQTTYGIPASGFFESLSRAKYFELIGNGGIGGGGIYLPPVDSWERKAVEMIKNALMMVEEAQDEIGDSNRSSSSAKTNLRDAEKNIIDSLQAYFIDRNFAEAYNRASDALQNAEEALDNGGNTDKNDAKEAIDDAEDAIDDAEDDINNAASAGQNVNEARRLLDKARDRLDDAEDEYDDKDYDDAEELAKDAEEFADDAVDAIGDNTNTDRNSADDAIDDAREAIDDAEDEISEAEDDGADVDDAEEILEDAEDKLDDAEEAFSHLNYNQAKNLAEDAEELAEDAVNEIDF